MFQGSNDFESTCFFGQCGRKHLPCNINYIDPRRLLEFLPISSFGRRWFYMSASVAIAYVFLSELPWALAKSRHELSHDAGRMGKRGAVWFGSGVLLALVDVLLGQYLENNPPAEDWQVESIALIWAFLAAAVVLALSKTGTILGLLIYAIWSSNDASASGLK